MNSSLHCTFTSFNALTYINKVVSLSLYLIHSYNILIFNYCLTASRPTINIQSLGIGLGITKGKRWL